MIGERICHLKTLFYTPVYLSNQIQDIYLYANYPVALSGKHNVSIICVLWTWGVSPKWYRSQFHFIDFSFPKSTFLIGWLHSLGFAKWHWTPQVALVSLKSRLVKHPLIFQKEYVSRELIKVWTLISSTCGCFCLFCQACLCRRVCRRHLSKMIWLPRYCKELHVLYVQFKAICVCHWKCVHGCVFVCVHYPLPKLLIENTAMIFLIAISIFNPLTSFETLITI